MAAGRTAILDATWSRRADREDAVALARRLGARTLFVETRCGPETALARLASRAVGGRAASDAGPGLYRRSAAEFERFDETREGPRRVIETDRPGWRGRFEEVARTLAS